VKLPFKKKQIDELLKRIEVIEYTQGMYGKMSASWDITVELNDDLLDDYLDEREGNNYLLPLRIKASCYEEDGGHSDWWESKVEVDKDCKITRTERELDEKRN
jgi:hypothetical protein